MLYLMTINWPYLMSICAYVNARLKICYLTLLIGLDYLQAVRTNLGTALSLGRMLDFSNKTSGHLYMRNFLSKFVCNPRI